MSTRIRFLGVAGYEIQGPDWRILVDPFLSANPQAPCSPDELETPDVILVSHAAYDHLGDAATISRGTGAPVVCGADVRLMLLEDASPTNRSAPRSGGSSSAWVAWWCVRSSAITGRTGKAERRRHHRHAHGVHRRVEPGVRIYHYGDTAIFDMRLFGELYAPTVGIFRLAQWSWTPRRGEMLTGEMDLDEAALAADMLGVQGLAFASHYISPTRDVEEFVTRVAERDANGQRVALSPEVGQTVVMSLPALATG